MRRYLVGAAIGAIVATAVGGLAFAATIPTSTNTINACYANSSGALRVATTACDPSTETPLSWQSGAFRIHKSLVANNPAVVVFSKYGLTFQLECISDANVTGEYDAWLNVKSSVSGAKLTGIYANNTASPAFNQIDPILSTAYTGLFRATGHVGDSTDALVDMDFVYTGAGHTLTIAARVIANGGNDACTADGNVTAT